MLHLKVETQGCEHRQKTIIENKIILWVCPDLSTILLFRDGNLSRFEEEPF
jgi:hypothetical protein